ncbi:unnamed protein product [Acanthoscelides obtectus]|uniref:Uncharacterized protein n=1 Tax=Acanthoscelides obtectus TaxID=200917 RepID=A0A9P0Q8X0_ACAOB|nr:unnamed protein product [Acanthoscelides obtectus]CAK1628388.1 hypothetical protein AOBTE_LOCUS5174 [Acanthoscelides obtectus]
MFFSLKSVCPIAIRHGIASSSYTYYLQNPRKIIVGLIC